jgi:hypothetical protein
MDGLNRTVASTSTQTPTPHDQAIRREHLETVECDLELDDLLTAWPTQPVRPPQRDRPTGESKAWNFDSSCQACLLFQGIENWPPLNYVFHRLAVVWIARAGITSWLSYGGTWAADGSPTFGSWSPIAAAILHQIAVRTGAFHYVDEQGDQWAVLVASEDPGSAVAWRGLAIGGEFSPCLLSYQVREHALQAIARELNELDQPAILCTDNAGAQRLRLLRWGRRVGLLDLGVRVLPRLVRSAARHPTLQATVRLDALARAAWGPGDNCWPAEWESLVFDAIASLCSVQVQVLDLPKMGWCPRTISRRQAITRITRQDGALIRVRFARPFLTFLGHWLGPERAAAQFTTSVRNASIANLDHNPFQDVGS